MNELITEEQIRTWSAGWAAGYAAGTKRDCQCPDPNEDCEHPTCPRWPQPGHLRAVIGQWLRASHDPPYGDDAESLLAHLQANGLRIVEERP